MMILEGLRKFFALSNVMFAHSMKLENITGQQAISMNYTNYDALIRVRYKVELRGWPAGVKFAAPSSIGAVGDITTLHDGLKSGECCWVKLAQREAQQVEASKKPQKERKIRSDKGVKRGPRKRKSIGDDGGEDEASGMAQKRSKTANDGVVSREVIDEDDE
jgi:hypothetical protein